ncbi:MAG: short subunit dehydrogenase-like uncharacterized protein [Myxococcota bacterium]|jgi:short subunit dehydrogenase-like uncharacterized protein
MPELDVVVFGATGFTGQLVAEYLIAHHAELRIGLAGRSQSKLEQVRAALAVDDPDAAELPLIVADSFDAASLSAMCRQTAVVCSTVGPYMTYGHALVEACAASGTHYCDLTGEVTFTRASIDNHSAAAAASGARIVHSCGFDSVPSDMGTWMVQQAAIARFGRPLDRVLYGLGRNKGGASGGTVASMLTLMEQAATDRDVRRLLLDPYALNPEGERSGPDGRDRMGLSWSDAFGGWVAPFLMAPVNTRVVRRTNAVLGYPYGRDFRYDEVVSCGPGPSGLKRAVTMTATYAGMGSAVLPPMRSLLRRVLPSPGEGPSKEQREAGHFTVHLKGWGVDQHGAAVTLDGTVKGFRDPGYGETAKMLGEAATCLAVDDLESEGGVWTPASGLGDAYLDRLRGAGMVFDI